MIGKQEIAILGNWQLIPDYVLHDASVCCSFQTRSQFWRRTTERWRCVGILLSKLKAVSLRSSRSARQRSHLHSMLAFRSSAQPDILEKLYRAYLAPDSKSHGWFISS